MEFILGFIFGLAFLIVAGEILMPFIDAEDRRIKKLIKFVQIRKMNKLKEKIVEMANANDKVKKQHLLNECKNMVKNIKRKF